MKRGLLVLALVFSLGVNIGLAFQILAPGDDLPAKPQPELEPQPTDTEPLRAQNPVDRRGQRRPGMRQIVDRLGLEGERRRQFVEVKRDFFRRTTQQRQEVQALQAELAELVAQPEVDKVQMYATLERLAAAHGELERLFVEHYLATLDLLEPDEQQIYRSFILDQVRPGLFRQRPKDDAARR